MTTASGTAGCWQMSPLSRFSSDFTHICVSSNILHLFSTAILCTEDPYDLSRAPEVHVFSLFIVIIKTCWYTGKKWKCNNPFRLTSSVLCGFYRNGYIWVQVREAGWWPASRTESFIWSLNELLRRAARTRIKLEEQLSSEATEQRLEILLDIKLRHGQWWKDRQREKTDCLCLVWSPNGISVWGNTSTHLQTHNLMPDATRMQHSKFWGHF